MHSSTRISISRKQTVINHWRCSASSAYPDRQGLSHQVPDPLMHAVLLLCRLIAVPSRDPASIGRLVLQSLGSPEWWAASDSSSSNSWQSMEGDMLAAVAKLRLAVQDATCAAVVTCPASKCHCTHCWLRAGSVQWAVTQAALQLCTTSTGPFLGCP